MPRRSWVWCPKRKELVEISPGAQVEQRAPMVVPDIPDYVSPVTGKLVSGRRQRREDLLMTNSRPYEGLEQERKEAQRRVAYAEQARDRRLDEGVRKIYHQMPVAHRRAIEGR